MFDSHQLQEMGNSVLLSVTKNGAYLALLVFLLSCTQGKCELAKSKSSDLVITQTVEPFEGNFDKPQAYPEQEKINLPVFTMDYDRIQIPLEFTLWVLLASFAKIGFNIYQKVTIWIPESCLLISIGLIVGAIMHSVKEEPPAILRSNIFFLYMLPPIILDSGYFLPTRAFFENAGTVLWYAVVGTLWNSVGIGISLFAVCQFEVFGLQDINLQENLLFASIISAVDPVAALNVFEDVGVNEQLYIVIFGEGLFNDAVILVLYSMFAYLVDMPEVLSEDVFLGVARFFVVGVGGFLFGFVFGFAAAFTSRFTNKVREIEPLFVFIYSYLAYLVAELFAISSVTSIITCALTMKYYVEENVSQRSCTTIRHVVKMLSTISETLIFFFLGVVTITTEHEWNWAFMMFTLLFAFLWRGIGILLLTQIINPFRTIQFTLKDQFGLAYGGLRGAICFALVFTLGDVHRKQLFVTASIVIIIFTVFIQGISIRPIVENINIRKTNKDLNTINVEIHTRMMEHVVCGIEDLCGQWSHYYWKDKFKRFNDRILKRILLRDRRAESSIVSLYKKLELQSALELLDTSVGDISAAPSIVSLDDEKRESTCPKKKFLAEDVKKMQELLSRNMYKIRQRTTAYRSKYSLPDDTHTRQILIRRHASIRRSVRSDCFRERPPTISKSLKYYSLQPGGDLSSAFAVRRRSQAASSDLDPLASSGRSARSSSRSMVGTRKLNAIEERPQPDQDNQEVLGSNLRCGRAPVPAPRRRSAPRTEFEGLPASSPAAPPWIPENMENEAANQLLRCASSSFQKFGKQ